MNEFGWLTERQFLDAVAVAMITPGPVVITVAFIGYLVGGPPRATLAALGTFLPCYLFVVIPAPYFQRLSRNPFVGAFVAGVTAAATGAITGAAFVLGRRAIFDVWTAVIAIVTLLVLVKVKKAPEPLVILATASSDFSWQDELFHGIFRCGMYDSATCSHLRVSLSVWRARR